MKQLTIKELREMTGYLVEVDNMFTFFYQYPIPENGYIECEGNLIPCQDIYFIDVCLN